MVPNLLLISVDSLRLDHAHPMGSNVATPRFARAVQQYGFSPQCFSPSSATRPVHASLFSGLYPFEHGVWGMHYPHTRPDCPDLFDLLEAKGYRVEALSEVASIFTGLGFARRIRPLAVDQPLSVPADLLGPQALFMHFWSTHTPYGAADGKAMGQTLELLRAGRVDIVRQRYRRAVEQLFEQRLAPLLERLDPGRWCVFIFGDHGERWTAEEYYHGQTLHNEVLRVPLWYNIPHTGNPALSGPVSLLDLFPTLVRLGQLGWDYRGYGVDLLGPSPAWHLAQLEPTPGDDEGVLQQPDPGNRMQPAARQWAVFDAERKYTYDAAQGLGWLEKTRTGQRLSATARGLAAYQERYAEAIAHSAYGQAPLPQAEDAAQELLEQRLRALGYLD